MKWSIKKKSYVSSCFLLTCLFSCLEKASFPNFCLSDLALLCSPVLATTLGSSWRSRKEKNSQQQIPKYTHFPPLSDFSYQTHDSNTIKTVSKSGQVFLLPCHKSFKSAKITPQGMVPRTLICSLTTHIWQLEGPVPSCFSPLPMSWQGVGSEGPRAPLGIRCTAIQLVLTGINWRDEGSWETTCLCECREKTVATWDFSNELQRDRHLQVETSTIRKEDLLYIFRSYRHLKSGVLWILQIQKAGMKIIWVSFNKLQLNSIERKSSEQDL